MGSRTSQYLDEAYVERLESIADENPDVTYAEVEGYFLDECSQFHTFMDDETPLEVIKRVALQKTKNRLVKS